MTNDIHVESGFETTLALKLDPTDVTMTVATAPTVTAGRLFIKSGSTKEWIEFTGVTGTTLTGLVRGLSSTADPATSGTGETWLAGTKVRLVYMHDQIYDRQNPVSLVFATTAARDAALGADGAATSAYVNVYCTAEGLFYNYNLSSNTWESIETGTVTPNASDIAAGKVEFNTTAQSIAATDIGETGALTVNHPSDIAANIQSGTFLYAVDSEASDTYKVEFTPTLTEYTIGQVFLVKFNTVNTGACTLEAESLGAKAIKLKDGNDPFTGDIPAGAIIPLIYDGTNFVLQKTGKFENSLFGGDGSDGAVAGALTITGSNNTYIEKNYTTFTPGANTVTVTPTGCVVHIKVSGDADLTGSTFTFTGKGTAGGTGGIAGGGAASTNGTDVSVVGMVTGGLGGQKTSDQGDGGGGGAGAAGLGGPGTLGDGTTQPADRGLNYNFANIETYHSWNVKPGAGGGGGGGSTSISGNGGAGGAGGGCLILEVKGNLTFSSTAVNCDGVNGENGVVSGQGGGGGGGGGGGTFVYVYGGTLTGTPTTDVGGGTGGTAGGGSGNGGAGGAGYTKGLPYDNFIVN